MTERRSSPRFPVDFEVTVRILGTGDAPGPHDAEWKQRFRRRLRDIGVGGLYVEWPDPQPPLRSHVEVHIQTEGGHDLTIRGEVVWITTEADAHGALPAGFGLQFVGTTAAQVKAIADLLDGLTPEDIPREDVPKVTPISAPKVLVLEDDPEIRRFTTTILSRLPALVVSCKSGREAIDAFERRSFDLCVLDYLVPEIDGLGVVRHIRENSNVPVLMLTAVFSPSGLHRSGLEKAADEVLSKPFTAGQLRAAVRRLLTRRKQG